MQRVFSIVWSKIQLPFARLFTCRKEVEVQLIYEIARYLLKIRFLICDMFSFHSALVPFLTYTKSSEAENAFSNAYDVKQV